MLPDVALVEASKLPTQRVKSAISFGNLSLSIAVGASEGHEVKSSWEVRHANDWEHTANVYNDCWPVALHVDPGLLETNIPPLRFHLWAQIVRWL
eukprot:1968030-Amphidinium_carterae.1